MFTALVFLEIQSRTAEHTEHTLVTWNLRWRALIKLNHKQHPARLISLSLSLFNSPSLHPLRLPISTPCHFLTLFLCLFFFLPSPLSLPSWAAELTAHLALTHRAYCGRSIVTNIAHGSYIKRIKPGCKQTIYTVYSRIFALHLLTCNLCCKKRKYLTGYKYPGAHLKYIFFHLYYLFIFVCVVKLKVRTWRLTTCR